MLKTVLLVSSKLCVEKTVKRCLHNETIPPEYVKMMEKNRQMSQKFGKIGEVEVPGK